MAETYSGDFQTPLLVCTNCGAGQYQVASGSTSCVTCTAGTYLPTTGSSAAASCGKRRRDLTTPPSCPKGNRQSLAGTRNVRMGRRPTPAPPTLAEPGPATAVVPKRNPAVRASIFAAGDGGHGPARSSSPDDLSQPCEVGWRVTPESSPTACTRYGFGCPPGNEFRAACSADTAAGFEVTPRS